MARPRILSTNALVNNPAYSIIIDEYNRQLRQDGKVNAGKFYYEVILPKIPNYKLPSWYQFLRKFKTEAGVRTPPVVGPIAIADIPVVKGEAGQELAEQMLNNHEALQISIAAAMNISARALKDILENPEMIPAEKRAELFLKIMKAQDSRVKTVGAIRADNREQERFDRAMDSAAF